MRRIVLTFGLIAGGLLSLMMVVSMAFHEQIGFDRGLVVGYTTMVLSFLLVFFGVRTYRDTVGGGSISFGRALGVGLLISLVACVCYVVTWQFVYRLMMPDYMERYAAYVLEKARASGATAEQLAAQSQEMARFREMYRNPLVNAAMTFVEPLPVALLMTLVSAGILRRRGPAVERVAAETSLVV